MATQEPRFYDAHDVMASERRAEAETVELPPVDPQELEAKYLLGIAFPASRDDVLGAAHANGAPQRIVTFLEGLEGREYADAGELAAAVEDAGGARRETIHGAGAPRPSEPRAEQPTQQSEPPAPIAAASDSAAAVRGRPRLAKGVGIGLVALGLLVVVRRRRRR